MIIVHGKLSPSFPPTVSRVTCAPGELHTVFFVFVFAVSEFLFFIAVGEFHTVLRTCEGLRDATSSFGVSSPALAVSVYHDLYLSLPVSVLSTFSLPCPLFPSCRLSRPLLPLTLLGAPVNIGETQSCP